MTEPAELPPDIEPPDFEREGPTGRTPPQDLAAERSVLGAMMLSKDAIGVVTEILVEEDFYRPAHQSIYRAILDLYGHGEPADNITVTDRLGKSGDLVRVGGPGYVAGLTQEVATAMNAEYHAQVVFDRAVRRRIAETGMKISDAAYAGEGEAEQLVNLAQAEIYSVTQSRQSEDYRPLRDIIDDGLNEIESISQRDGEMHGVPTGLRDLDSLTHGLQAGQLVIVAARPAIGKSTLGLDIARNASIRHGLTSVIFSLEMSRTEIFMRMLSAEAGIQLNHIRSGRMSDVDWQRIADRQDAWHNAPLFIDDSPNMTMTEIRAKCRRLAQQHDLRLVVLDYMQLMTSGKRVESRQQEVSEFSRALKLLAKELEVPVIAVSQLNRGPEQRTDKKPMLSDLRESGCLTADTRLLRADTGEEVSLGELYATGAHEIPVWSLDETLRYRPRTMTHVFRSGHREVFEVRTESGRVLRATTNHPLLTMDGWVAVGDLSRGSKIAVARHVPPPIHLAGVDESWAADLGRRTVADHDAKADVPQMLAGAPKAQVAACLRAAWEQAGVIRHFPGHSSGSVHLRTRARRVADGFARLLLRFGLLAQIVVEWEEDELPTYLVRVVGTADQKVFLATISPSGRLAEAAAGLLGDIETYGANNDAEQVAPQVWLDLRDTIASDQVPVAVPSGGQSDTPVGVHQPQADGSRVVGVAVRNRLAEVADVLDRADLDLAATNDVAWDSVEAIRSLGQQDVFDATVIGTHNFIADGVAVHNSLEQDADVVILIHREDFYDKETRPGEADLIVAKHRNGPTDTINASFQGHYSRFVDLAG